MRILQIIDILKMGGAQKLLITFTQEANQRGIQTDVLCLNHEKASENIIEELTINEAQVVMLPKTKLINPFRIREVAQFIHENNYDFVQTHLTYANITGIIAAKLVGVPAVPTFHSVSFEKGIRNQLREWVEQLIISSTAARVICVGRKVAQAHKLLNENKKIEIIPNAVSLPIHLPDETRSELRQELTGNPSAPIFIAVGRFSPPKGYEDLIRAFDIVKNSQPAARLLLVGGGRLWDDIHNLITELNLTENIILTGERDDVPSLLAASDIYVLSSHWEGLPLAVLEAMMAGLPIIATNVGDLPEVISPQTGILVPPQQPEQLAAAMLSLLQNPEKQQQMGHAARSYALQTYSPAVWFDRMLNLYAKISNRDISEYLSKGPQI